MHQQKTKLLLCAPCTLLYLEFSEVLQTKTLMLKRWQVIDPTLPSPGLLLLLGRREACVFPFVP